MKGGIVPFNDVVLYSDSLIHFTSRTAAPNLLLYTLIHVFTSISFKKLQSF